MGYRNLISSFVLQIQQRGFVRLFLFTDMSGYDVTDPLYISAADVRRKVFCL